MPLEKYPVRPGIFRKPPLLISDGVASMDGGLWSIRSDTFFINGNGYDLICINKDERKRDANFIH